MKTIYTIFCYDEGYLKLNDMNYYLPSGRKITRVIKTWFQPAYSQPVEKTHHVYNQKAMVAMVVEVEIDEVVEP